MRSPKSDTSQHHNPPGFGLVALILAICLSPFLSAAIVSWLLTDQILSLYPEYAGSFWLLLSEAFFALLLLELLIISFILAPVCPKCGARLLSEGNFELSTPARWANSLVAPQAVIEVDSKHRCRKCGTEFTARRSSASPRDNSE